MYNDIQCICYAQCNDFKIHVQCIEYIYSVTCRMQCLYTTYMYNDEQFHVYIIYNTYTMQFVLYMYNAGCMYCCYVQSVLDISKSVSHFQY